MANDEEVRGRFWRALVNSAIQLASEAGSRIPREIFTGEDAFRSVTENVIRRLVDSSNCVIVGRAAAIVLLGRPDVLSVRLDGPVNARTQQAVAALHLTEAQANSKLQKTDRARKEYVRHFCGRDWADPSLYHLMIDSTALPLATCSQVILLAARGRGVVDRTSP